MGATSVYAGAALIGSIPNARVAMRGDKRFVAVGRQFPRLARGCQKRYMQELYIKTYTWQSEKPESTSGITKGLIDSPLPGAYSPDHGMSYASKAVMAAALLTSRKKDGEDCPKGNDGRYKVPCDRTAPGFPADIDESFWADIPRQSEEAFAKGVKDGIDRAETLLSGDCLSKIEELMVSVARYESEKANQPVDAELSSALKSHYTGAAVIAALRNTQKNSNFVNDSGNTRIEAAAFTAKGTVTLYARYFYTIERTVLIDKTFESKFAKSNIFKAQTMLEEGIHLIGLSDESVGEFLLNKGDRHGRHTGKVDGKKGAEEFRKYIEKYCPK